MHLLFLDESGTPPHPNKAKGRYLVIGGLIIPEEEWHGAARALADVKRRFGVNGEIKWRYFGDRNNDPRNILAKLDQPQRENFRNEVFDIITSRENLKIIACVTCVEAAYAMSSVSCQDDIYHLTYKGVTERFQYYLQDRSSAIGSSQFGMVISDHRMKSDDAKLRRHHHELVEKKNPFSSTYENLIETIQFSPSDFSAGLQLADMAAGAVHRAYQYQEKRFAERLKSSFRARADGRIMGYGLVHMPKATFIPPSGGEAKASPTR